MKSPLAVFTITQNDGVFLRRWMEHYLCNLCAADIYVLDHDSTGDSADFLGNSYERDGITVLPVRHELSFDPRWLTRIVSSFQRFLLDSYRTVVFTATDELLTLSPAAKQETTLFRYLSREGPLTMMKRVARCRGYELVHLGDEPALDFSRPLLAQRQQWYRAERYSKPAVARDRVHWQPGFHKAVNVPDNSWYDSNLWLIHVHRADFQTCLARHRERTSRRWPGFLAESPYLHNLIEDPELLQRWIVCNADQTSVYAKLESIPEEAKGLL